MQDQIFVAENAEADELGGKCVTRLRARLRRWRRRHCHRPRAERGTLCPPAIGTNSPSPMTNIWTNGKTLRHRRVDMLPDRNAMPTIAVKNLAAARKFYGGTLHLKESGPEVREATTYKNGNSTIVVYQSQYAETNSATAATWNVGDEFDAVVRSLRNAEVAFEHYDMPGVRRDGDVHIVEDFKTAWFTDPDGNILNVNNG